jgi:site-specific recombinase XerC
VVRLEDGEAGLAARTIARRLSSVRGLYAYLTATPASPAIQFRPAWRRVAPAVGTVAAGCR